MKAIMSREGNIAIYCMSRDAISINGMHAFRDEV